MNVAMPLVVDDRSRGLFRVHRSAFASEEILEMERERIFNQAWLYVGHESEVKKPGDFVTRGVGGRTVIFNRDRHGVIRVMLNTCRHRGASGWGTAGSSRASITAGHSTAPATWSAFLTTTPTATDSTGTDSACISLGLTFIGASSSRHSGPAASR
jgi:Rieske [2Fe-2S] domain